jgi:TP901 family phage tail tape measure protein
MALSSIGGIVIPIIVMQTGDKNALAKLRKQFADLSNTIAQVNKEFSSQASVISTTSDKVKKKVQQSVDAHNAEAAAIALKNQELTKWSKTVQHTQWGKTEKVTTRTPGQIVDYDEGGFAILGTKTEVKDVNPSVIQSMNALRWSIVNVTFAMTALAGIVYPFVELTKYGMELESLFTKIEVVTDAAAKSTLESIRSLREGTMFSIEEMGGAFLEFAKQGFGAQQALSALPAIMSLSIVGFTDLDTATRITAQTMHQFSLEADQASHIADVLAKAANISAADVETFGVSMSYAGPIAAQAGMSFEQTAASLAILSNMGLSASKSGTSLAAALTQMIKPTDRTKAAMSKMGLSFFEASGEMKDMDTIIREMSAVLGGLPDEEKLKFITSAFGARGARAVSGLLSSLDTGAGGISTFTDRVNDTNYALEQMLKVQETSAGRLKAEWNDFKDGFVDMADDVNNALGTILQNTNLDKLEDDLKKINNELTLMGHDTIPLLEREGNKIENSLNFLDKLGVVGEITKLFAKPITFLPHIGAQQFRRTISTPEDVHSTKTAKSHYDQASSLLETYKELESMGNVFRTDELKNHVSIYGNLKHIIDTSEEAAKGLLSPEELRERELILGEISKYLGEFSTFSLKETAESAIGEIKTLFESDAITDSMVDALYEQHPVLKQIIELGLEDKDINREIVALLVEKQKELKEIYNIQERINASQRAYNTLRTNLLEKLLSKDDSKTFTELKDLVSSIQDIIDGSRLSGEGSYLSPLLFDIHMGINEARGLEIQIDNTQASLDSWKDKIGEANDELDRLNGIMDTHQSELKDINTLIKQLEKPRFTGQLDTEKLMNELDHFILNQDFMARTGVNAQEFIQRALSNTAGGFENLISIMDDVDSTMNNSKNSYDAWKETVEEFITSAIKSGNILGSNVTGAIEKFSTQLLSTSKFEDEQNKQSNAVNNLKDAYTLYYGEMTDEVDFAVKAHEEGNRDIFDSSQDVITSLYEQWKALDMVGNKIDLTQKYIDIWTENLDEATSEVKTYTDELDILKESLSGIAEEYANITANALEAQQYISGNSSGSSSAYNDLMEKYKDGPIFSNPKDSVKWDGSSYFDHSFVKKDDFLMRPGLPAVNFSPQDTIIGVKDTSSLGGNNISIGNINVNGASGDPNEIARRLVDEIKMEMRLG